MIIWIECLMSLSSPFYLGGDQNDQQSQENTTLSDTKSTSSNNGGLSRKQTLAMQRMLVLDYMSSP